MKPIVIWVVLGNARPALVCADLGRGNGLTAVSDQSWQAPEVPKSRDKAGVGHIIRGRGVSAAANMQPKELAENRFSNDIVEGLSEACHGKKSDRPILTSGPHMMGLLCANLEAPLSIVLIGEIPKDLPVQSLSDVKTHRGELVAV